MIKSRPIINVAYLRDAAEVSPCLCDRLISFSPLYYQNIKNIALPLCILTLTAITTSLKAEEEGSFGVTNFAFSSYLGTGFYSTSGQDVFVIQLPFSFQIRQMTDEEAGWKLRLPLTIGIINLDGTFDGIGLDSTPRTDALPELDDVTTLTFLPGIEYQYPVTPDWNVRPFFDYGFARDFNYTNNILIIGTGISSYYDFYEDDTRKFTLINKFIYAREGSKNSGENTDYTLIETGINYRITTDHVWGDKQVYVNPYFIYFYYPDDLVLLERTTTPIRVGNEREIGFTLSNLPDMLFLENPELGFGIRRGSGVTAYRLVFGVPF
jgi:hypothetical protein